MKKKNKKARRFVRMPLGPFKLASVLGQLGLGREEIARRAHLTKNQVTYRTSMYRDEMGFQETLGQTWRHGNHPILGMILEDYAGILEHEFDRKLVPKLQLTHTKLEFSKKKERPAPTVDEAVAILKKKKAGF